jgi:hypothetical protein
MSENQNADLGTAQNNTTGQPNNPTSGALNEETLADILRNTLFADVDEQPVQPEAEKEGEVQTEVKDEVVEDASAQEAEPEEVPQAEDGEESEVLSQETQDEEGTDGNLSKGVQKRIDKLTAKRKQAEEEVANLRKEVDALKQAMTESRQSGEEAEPSVKDANNPFSSLKTKDAVDKEIEQARWLRYKCMENPEGFSMGETYFGPEDVKRMMVNSTKAIEEQLPKQIARIEAEERIRPIAEANYPWWKNPSTKEHQLAQQVIKNFPAFKNHPDYMLFVGDYVRGFMARESTAAAQKAKPMTKAPVQPIRPTVAPKKSNPNEVKNVEAERRFAKSTNAEDLAKVLLSKGFI